LFTLFRIEDASGGWGEDDEFGPGHFRSLRFVHEASNVILLGPPGVGKTHLSVALAEATIQSGFGAYFIAAHDLVADLGRAHREGRLDRRMRVYLAPKVLIIDEMGCLPLDDMGATIFFQLVIGCCEGENRKAEAALTLPPTPVQALGPIQPASRPDLA
jgi:IstB-like ATP binding protein